MSILDNIINQKRIEITNISKNEVQDGLFFETKSFLKKLNEPRLHLIAEVKHASPSKGIIYNEFDPILLAKNFEKNGASCISVLTDEKFFQGNKTYLTEIKKQSNLPILRKDFIIDPIQVKETKAIGADIMLLILDILDVNQANELIQAAESEKLETLIEIHSNEAFEKLIEIDEKKIVGVNNRDLRTFTCDKNRAIEFSKEIKKINKNIKVIAESGYSDANEMNKLENNDINGVLIGEGLSKNKKLLEWFNHEN